MSVWKRTEKENNGEQLEDEGKEGEEAMAAVDTAN